MSIDKILLILNKHLKLPLTPLQELILKEACQGATYQKIADGYGCSSDYVREIGAQLWLLLSEAIGEEINKRNCRRILERYAQEQQLSSPGSARTSLLRSASRHHDWEEAIDVSRFLGRVHDLDTLQNWILKDHCRLVGVFGIGGIGKTALAVKLAQTVQDAFDFLIWRSLRNAPPLKPLLIDILKPLSRQQVTEQSLPPSEGELISVLIRYLQQQRCLLVLDNAETILQSGDRCGQYRTGYEAYGELLKRVGEIPHPSCLIVTSREKPREFSILSGNALPVRSYQLAGLTSPEGKQLLELKGVFSGSGESWSTLINLYTGNPLALKIAGGTIQDLFDGDIPQFLAQGIAVCDDVSALLAEQFDRLSALEQEIMYWFAIEREPIELADLQQNILQSIANRELLESVKSLHRRSLILKTASGLTQQPVVMEYVCDRFSRKICAEITATYPHLLNNHALMKAKTKDYIRQAQQRIILSVIAQQLQENLKDITQIGSLLEELIAIAQQNPDIAASYLASNIIHLKQQLGIPLEGNDFSGLTIRQAQLQTLPLPGVKFNQATFVDTAFTQRLSGIHSVAFSPDGNYLAAGHENGDVIIWDRVHNQQRNRLLGHTHGVASVAFSPHSQVLASGSVDHTLRLWDVQTGALIATHTNQVDQVWAVTYSPDGKVLASGSMDGIICLRHPHTGESFQTLTGHTGQVSSIAFSPDGQFLLNGFVDGTVSLWDVKTGGCHKTYPVHQGIVWSVAFHPDGQSFFSCGGDTLAKQIQLETGACLQTLKGHARQLTDIVCSVDGQTLISGSHDHTVRCWNVQTGECHHILEAHNSFVWGVALSPDNQVIASGSLDRTVRLWDYPSGKQLYSLQGQPYGICSVAFSLDEKRVISGEEDGMVRVWDWARQTERYAWQTHQGIVASIMLHPFRPYLATGGEDGTVKLWDLDSQKLLHTFQRHQTVIFAVAFSPDGTVLASGCRDWFVKIWDLKTKACLKTIHEQNKILLGNLKFSPDGKTLVTASYDGCLRLWDTETWECYRTLRGHTHYMTTSVAVSSDSQFIISGSHDRTIRIWDMATGECLRVLEGHTDEISAVALSPDDQLIASTGYDATVRLWDMNTGNCLQVLRGHQGGIRAVQFSADGQRLVSGGSDRTLQFWNVATGQRLMLLQPPRLYERMDITDIQGLTKTEKETLRSLGAIDSSDNIQR